MEEDVSVAGFRHDVTPHTPQRARGRASDNEADYAWVRVNTPSKRYF